MGHVKLKNHTGQTLNIKVEREQAPEDLPLTHECKDLENKDLPVWFDLKSGKVTNTIITITQPKGVKMDNQQSPYNPSQETKDFFRGKADGRQAAEENNNNPSAYRRGFQFGYEENVKGLIERNKQPIKGGK